MCEGVCGIGPIAATFKGRVVAIHGIRDVAFLCRVLVQVRLLHADERHKYHASSPLLLLEDKHQQQHADNHQAQDGARDR